VSAPVLLYDGTGLASAMEAAAERNITVIV
jgi:hypothetical protein